MSAGEWGTLKEPTRAVPPGESEQSRAARRADQSSPGEWDEDLGRYGSEVWNPPGFGETGSGCGEWFPESVCTECGHVHLTSKTCGNRSCPNCWGIWAREAAVRAATRIQSFRQTQPPNYRRQVAHAVVAPPEGSIRNERQFYEGRKRAAEIVKEKGFRGFAVVPHPWRVTESGKQEYREKVERDDNGNPVVGRWVWLRNEFTEAELRKRIYWSPHYHIIGATTKNMEPAKESDEWVYHFIRPFGSYEGIRDRDSHEDMYGAFRYLLSHTGYPEGSTKQAVTWYGDLSNSKFVETATEDYETEKPSQSVRRLIKSEIEAVAGPTSEDDESDGQGPETDDVGDCPLEDCDGVLIDVFDVQGYLIQNQPPPEVSNAMRTAYEWRMGDVQPPPGMKHPQTEEQAREALEAML